MATLVVGTENLVTHSESKYCLLFRSTELVGGGAVLSALTTYF